MISLKEKKVKGIISNFSKLKKKKNLTSQDEDKLVNNLTNLIGIFAVDKSKQLERYIEAMIDFAKKQKWGIQGSIIQFKKVKQKKK